MSQIVNRIDHVVYMCRPENHDAYVEKLSKLFEIEFEADDGGPEFGLRFTWSWSAGLEVISPSGEDSEFARMCWDHIEKKGEGLFSVVFGVADVERTRDRAISLGYAPSHLLKLHDDLYRARTQASTKGIDVSQERQPWQDRVEDCTECVLEHFLDGNLAIGRIITN